MSTVIPVSRGARIYGADPDPKATDVVSIDATRINPDTDTTLIDDSAIPLTLSLGGANRVLTKNIKLMTGAGATINTGAGTILLDGDNDEVDVVYSSAQNAWKSNPAGMIIPITPTRSYISTAVEIGSDVNYVGQGEYDSTAMSMDGQIIVTGAPGWGSKIQDSGSGIVWVYERDGFDWVRTHTINTSLSGLIYFGASTTTNKNGSVVVGAAPLYGGGVDIVFELDTVNKVYNETAVITPIPPAVPGITISNSGSRGSQIELNGEGDILVIGQNFIDTFTFGPKPDTFIWVYIKNKITNTWYLSQIIDGMIERKDMFGHGMDMSADGNVIAVGNPRFTNGTVDYYGAVQTYTKSLLGAQASFTATLSGATLAGLDGKYFVFTASSITYFVWYDSTGATLAPVVPGATGIRVDISFAVFPLDTSVPSITASIINTDIPPAIATATSSSNVFTVTNTDIGTQHSVKDAGTDFVFNQTNIGAGQNQYSTGAERIINASNDRFFGANIALNADGRIMAVSGTLGIYLYSRTTTTSNWTLNATFIYGNDPLNAFIFALDINSRGNVVIAGVGQSGAGVLVFANTNGTWKIKAYDVLEPYISNNTFGRSARISGDGALAVVGDPSIQNPSIGIKWVYQMNTIEVNLGGGAPQAPFYFIIEAADDQNVKYVVWYKLTDTMSAPPPNLHPLSTPSSSYWKTIQVDVRGYTSFNQNQMLVTRTIDAINGSSLTKDIVTAGSTQDGYVLTITSKLAGVFGGVYDAFNANPPAPYYPTTFNFSQTTAGGTPATVGAIWTLG